MRRIVLAVVALEVVALLALFVASRSPQTDAAGRGLAAGYLLVLGAPVALAAVAWLGGYSRVAGVLALAPVAMWAFFWFNRPPAARPEPATDWFADARVAQLLTALASPSPAALQPFAGQRDVLNAISTDSSRTFLTFAAPQYPGSVGTLIELGADPNLAPPHGLHPVIAALNEPVMVLRQLLAHRANPNAELRPGEPALHQALWQRKFDHALLLIDAGADLAARDRIGRTPLYAAVDNYAWKVATRLLERGADPSTPANDGKTVRALVEQPEWAAYHDVPDFQAFVAALRAHGVDVQLPAGPAPAPPRD